MKSESDGKQGLVNKQSKEKPATLSEAERIEAKIDRDLRDSFPASDPPGWTLGIDKRRPTQDKT